MPAGQWVWPRLGDRALAGEQLQWRLDDGALSSAEQGDISNSTAGRCLSDSQRKVLRARLTLPNQQDPSPLPAIHGREPGHAAFLFRTANKFHSFRMQEVLR